ncbi:MAG TPA: response regulator [Bryobacterales bacterium]|nr:response regulator [Bryobacterales bacterium]
MKKVLVVEDDRPTRYLLSKVLKAARFSVATAQDGVEGLKQLRKNKFDLVLLDIWMPRMNGLELLAHMRNEPWRPKAVVMTSDNTPETLLRAVRDQAYQYISKPVDPKGVVKLVEEALAASPAPPIEVLSARPEWVELLVPCEVSAAERIQGFMARLDADLSEEVRGSIGQVFHEMLINAIEWGGRLDPNRKVRISCLRTRRMILYRIADPGPGFKLEELDHAAISYAPEQVLEHVEVRRQKGIRPGGFGILMARAMVDELIYNEARNEVVFIKYLD